MWNLAASPCFDVTLALIYEKQSSSDMKECRGIILTLHRPTTLGNPFATTDDQSNIL
jgi:hypothetical protein